MQFDIHVSFVLDGQTALQIFYSGSTCKIINTLKWIFVFIPELVNIAFKKIKRHSKENPSIRYKENDRKNQNKRAKK